MIVDLGEKLAKVREESLLTQNELSEAVGINFKLLSKWENGEYVPTLEELSIICNFLCVDFEIFLEAFKRIYSKREKEEEEEKLSFVSIIIGASIGLIIVILFYLFIFLLFQFFN